MHNISSSSCTTVLGQFHREGKKWTAGRNKKDDGNEFTMNICCKVELAEEEDDETGME